MIHDAGGGHRLRLPFGNRRELRVGLDGRKAVLAAILRIIAAMSSSACASVAMKAMQTASQTTTRIAPSPMSSPAKLIGFR